MWGRILRGGLAALPATAEMTAVMFAAKAAGLMKTPPPKEITARAGDKTGEPPQRSSPVTFDATWLALHVAFGTGCGALFGLLRPLLPRNAVAAGVIYGEAVWAANYAGLLPALGLYPPPDDDSTSRTGVMIVAHAVFGTQLAAIVSRGD